MPMSKFDQIRKNIKKKKRKIHFGYVFLVIVLIVSGYFVGVKYEERKRTELHKLGLIYDRDIESLETIIKRKDKKIDLYKKCFDSIPFDKPLNTKINSYFGWRRDPVITNKRNFHYGIDFKAIKNQHITAIADGKIKFSGYGLNFGYYIIIEHALGYETKYAHLNKLLMKKNTYVVKGDTIGLAGTTGKSTGVHLHYEIILNGKKIDPLPYLKYIK